MGTAGDSTTPPPHDEREREREDAGGRSKHDLMSHQGTAVCAINRSFNQCVVVLEHIGNTIGEMKHVDDEGRFYIMDPEVGPWKMAFIPWSDLMVQLPWFDSYKINL